MNPGRYSKLQEEMKEEGDMSGSLTSVQISVGPNLQNFGNEKPGQRKLLDPLIFE